MADAAAPRGSGRLLGRRNGAARARRRVRPPAHAARCLADRMARAAEPFAGSPSASRTRRARAAVTLFRRRDTHHHRPILTRDAHSTLAGRRLPVDAVLPPAPLAAIAASPIHCLLLCLRPLPVAFYLSVGERPSAKTDLSDGDCLSNKMTKNRIVQSFKDNP